ncbi:MAG: ABC transporter substrate-binding protein [Polyangiaceae bacterium]
MRGFKHTNTAWRYIRYAALAVGTALLVPQLASCNLVVDTSAEQCETDADCASKGGAFTGTLCSEQKVCERLVCASNSECTSRLGEPAVCRPADNSCAKLLTSDCTEIFPEDALMEGETIVLGFMGPLRDQFASVGIPLRQGAELALNEIETRTNGLPAVGGGGQQRHVVMLGCHDIDDPERVARHLVDDVQVPAILGPAFSGITVQVTTDVTIPGNVMTISASATSPDITTLKDKGLVWRTAPSDTIQAIPLAELVLKVEEILRNDGKLNTGESARIAIAAKDDAYGLGLADAVFSQMQAQGVGAASDSKLLLQRNYADPASNDNVDWETPATEIANFHPHIIFGLGTNEFVTELLTRVEAKWDSSDRPTYLLPEGGKVDELEGIVSAQPDLSSRILGTVPGAQLAPGYSGFAQRFSAFFNEPPGTFSEFAYDAAYLLAYSIAISGQAHPNGTQMAEAMKHMTCEGKMVVPAGPTGFSGYFQDAATNQCIDFDGVSGPLDFNNDTGEASSDIAIWCPERSGSSVSLSAQTEYYSAAKGAIQGDVTFCP